MRNRFLLSAFLLVCAISHVQAQVNFEKQGYSEAFDKATQQNKILFVYFYTDWCAPCKQIDTLVFSDPAIRAAINDNYVSLKLNAEKGEGIKLAKRYQVGGYPTFLFLDKNARAMGRIVGTRGNSDYLTAIKSQGKNDPARERREKMLKEKKQ